MDKTIKENAVGLGTGDELKNLLDIVQYSIKMKEEAIKKDTRMEVELFENDCIKFALYKDSIMYPGKVLMFDFIVPSTHLSDMRQLHDIFVSKLNEFILHVVEIENPTLVQEEKTR